MYILCFLKYNVHYASSLPKSKIDEYKNAGVTRKDFSYKDIKCFLLIDTPRNYEIGYLNPHVFDMMYMGILPLLPAEHKFYHSVFTVVTDIMKDQSNKLRKVLSCILDKLQGINLIYLFGSQVRGAVGPMSDYDLGVLIDRNDDGPQVRSELSHALARKFQTKNIDVVILNSAPIELVDDKKYTIQVASFKTDLNANKEADSLKGKGFETSVLRKGSYSIVCVGKFQRKEEAKQFSRKLRNRYKDCLVRRL